LEIESPPEVRKYRNCLVSVERIREHILRIALDWPRHLGEDTDKELARSVMPLLSTMKSALDPGNTLFSPGAGNAVQPSDRVYETLDRAQSLVERRLLGEPARTWLSRDTHWDLERWYALNTGIASRFIKYIFDRNAVAPASTANAAVLLSELDDLDPLMLLNGTNAAVPETSAWERRRFHPMFSHQGIPGLAHRFLARLVDLVQTLDEIRADLEIQNGTEPSAGGTLHSGWGFAETARGRLMHRVWLEKDRVSSYAIISPTCWNFAPEGAAQRCLRSLSWKGKKATLTAANLVVGAFDPCVAHSVRIH
jgi:coenzyme F420-reducing hydrogenase alpha subunit